MSETDEEFLKRMEEDPLDVALPWRHDLSRLLSLARRGAKVPDEPTEEMIDAGLGVGDGWGAPAPQDVWGAMLAAALKQTMPDEGMKRLSPEDEKLLYDNIEELYVKD